MRAALAVILLSAVVAGACADDDAGKPQAVPSTAAAPPTTTNVQAGIIHGVWITDRSSNYVSFNEDGSWTAEPTLDFEVVKDRGSYTFDGKVLAITADPGFACAGYGLPDEGNYEVDFTDPDTIHMTLIEDSCSPRANDFTSGLAQHFPSETTEAPPETG